MSILVQSIIPALTSLVIGILFTLLLYVITKIALNKIVQRTKSETDDFIAQLLIRNIKPLGYVITCIISWQFLPIDNQLDKIVLSSGQLIIIVIVIRLINRIILKMMERLALKVNDIAISTMLSSLRPMVRAIIWALGSTIFLQNIGVQMAAIWALLSAGGIGAGLALKEPVQEFFEYITILLDKPFESGEFININNVWATVDRVGVRSTRLKSVNGEIIIMSNSALTSGTIANYGQMKQRRLVHKLGVTYETNQVNMERIPSLLKSIVDNTNDAIFDRCHFVEFGSFSLDFELVYFIPTNSYKTAMEAQQTINMAIKRQFHEEGIEFAYPTSTLHLLNSKNNE